MVEKVYFGSRFKLTKAPVVTSEKTPEGGELCDMVIDWEQRRIFAIFPYMIHSKGYTYENLGKRIDEGKATLVQFDEEEFGCFGKDDKGELCWHDKVELYSDEVDATISE